MRLTGSVATVHAGMHAAVSIVGPLGDGPEARPMAQGEAPRVALQLQQAARANEVLLTSVLFGTRRARAL